VARRGTDSCPLPPRSVRTVDYCQLFCKCFRGPQESVCAAVECFVFSACPNKNIPVRKTCQVSPACGPGTGTGQVPSDNTANPVFIKYY